jgi:hypothetical protein
MINNQDTAWLKPALPDYIFTRFQKQKMSIVCWDRLNYFCSTASVDANLTLLKPAHRTDMLIELWHYHNEDDLMGAAITGRGKCCSGCDGT